MCKTFDRIRMRIGIVSMPIRTRIRIRNGINMEIRIGTGIVLTIPDPHTADIKKLFPTLEVIRPCRRESQKRSEWEGRKELAHDGQTTTDSKKYWRISVQIIGGFLHVPTQIYCLTDAIIAKHI
jgi:hypothetical protein